MRTQLRGSSIRGGMGYSWGEFGSDLMNVGGEVVSQPAFWSTISGTPAPTPTTVIYQAPPAAPAAGAAATNYTPWILGGVGLLAAAGIVWAMTGRKGRG